MNAIVAADRHWAIGREDRLLFHLPADMRRFRALTLNGTVIMGRRTLESFPGGMPLPGRTNIVLTKNSNYRVKGAQTVNSRMELFQELEKYPSEDVYIIGGDSVYQQMLPYCDRAYVTKIDFTYEADAYFPNLDEMDEWKVVTSSEEQTYFDLEYRFLKYEKAR